MSKIVYSGAFLTKNAQEQLLRVIPPIREDGVHYDTVVAHHVTMAFKSVEVPANLGEHVQVAVLAVAQNEHCMAVAVTGVESEFPVPHITVAHMATVQPKYSNELLQSVEWQPLRTLLILDAFIGIFMSGKVYYEMPRLSR